VLQGGIIAKGDRQFLQDLVEQMESVADELEALSAQVTQHASVLRTKTSV
jgi:hypothetical protein